VHAQALVDDMATVTGDGIRAVAPPQDRPAPACLSRSSRQLRLIK